MDANGLWKRFLSTGSVSDYVSFKNAEQRENEVDLEEQYEKFDQRFGYIRDTDQRGG